ncbi:MAG: hypothetical protein HYY01_04100 [Chloroflexi bacterium]|nr:hypothetical protein [Chloroflexota bacterium]
MPVSDRTLRLKGQSVHYLTNALAFLEAREAEKASEFLWGSFAQALKAVASLKGATLRSHGQLRQYARDLSLDLRDKDIQYTFLLAESLHRNFYELDSDLESIVAIATKVRATVAKLLDLLPSK